MCTRAALGGEVKVDTLDGPEPLRIPPGTQPNQVFRLRGKGVQFLDGNGRGDHYVHVNVRIPSTMTDEQRKLFEHSPRSTARPSRSGACREGEGFFRVTSSVTRHPG